MSDCAVVVCSDRTLFPAAYLLCLSARWPDVFLLTERGPHIERTKHAPFKVLTPEFLDRLPDNAPKQLTPFAFLRLLLPEIVPGYRRILYLDCDIRIAGDFSEIFQIDMGLLPVAAATDPGRYLAEPRFFNSGVLLIDCENWIREGITDKTLRTITRTQIYDQDALNQNCPDFVLLSPRWNFPCIAIETDIERELDPVFIHNYDKPWDLGKAQSRERALFMSAIKQTPFPEFGRATMKQRQRYIERIAKSHRRKRHQRELLARLRAHIDEHTAEFS